MATPDPSAGTLLPAGALPPRGRVRVVAGILGAIAGFADAVGFLLLFGVFTSHMSGNTTHLSLAVGEGEWTDAGVRLFPIVMFVVAIAVGTVVVELMRRRGVERERLAPLLLTEAALLAAFMLVAAWALDEGRLRPAGAAFFVLAGLLTLAMGLQTAVLRRIGGLTVHTTYVSGMLTQVSVGAVTWWFERRDGITREANEGDGPAAHAWLALAVWGCFAGGALLGTLAHRAVDEWALAVPIAVLLTLVPLSRSLTRRPR